MTIADRLDEAMTDGRKKISQSELYRMSGVPQPTINRILKGKGKKGPETATLLALASALKVEFAWLQQGVGPKQAAARDGNAHQGAEEAPGVAAVDHKAPRFMRHWLADDEAELLNQYRSMTPDGQRLTRIFAKRQKRDRRDDAVDEP